MTRAMGLLITLATLACGDSTGPPDPPELFITTDSVSYTLKESNIPNLFFMRLVTQFKNPLPDTVYFSSCSGLPFWRFEHLSDDVFTGAEQGIACAPLFLGETPFPPGSVRTDTLLWPFANGGNNEPSFNREIPRTFRVLFIVWDSVDVGRHTGREIAKELRISAPFDILPVPDTGGV